MNTNAQQAKALLCKVINKTTLELLRNGSETLQAEVRDSVILKASYLRFGSFEWPTDDRVFSRFFYELDYLTNKNGYKAIKSVKTFSTSYKYWRAQGLAKSGTDKPLFSKEWYAYLDGLEGTFQHTY